MRKMPNIVFFLLSFRESSPNWDKLESEFKEEDIRKLKQARGESND